MLHNIGYASVAVRKNNLDTAIHALIENYEDLWWYEKVLFPSELWSALNAWAPGAPEKTLRVLKATFLSASKSWYNSIIMFEKNPFVQVCKELDKAGLLEGEQGLANISSVAHHEAPKALLWELRAYNLQSRLTQSHFDSAIWRQKHSARPDDYLSTMLRRKIMHAPIQSHLSDRKPTVDSTMSRIYNLLDTRGSPHNKLLKQEIAAIKAPVQIRATISPKGDSPSEHLSLEKEMLAPKASPQSPTDEIPSFFGGKAASPSIFKPKFEKYLRYRASGAPPEDWDEYVQFSSQAYAPLTLG